MTQGPIGAALIRKEDARLVSGEGCYVDDLQFANMAYGVMLRSPHAHARIRSIDATAAKAAPGALLVLTSDDPQIARLGRIPWELPPPLPAGASEEAKARLELGLQPILARGAVRYVGEPVAFVVGRTLDAAADAAEQIRVDYDELASVTAPERAVMPNAPLLHPKLKDNIYFTFAKGDPAAVEAAFAGAHHVTELELRNNRLAANPIEPRGCIGDFDPVTQRYMLYAATGKPHLLKRDIAGAILGIAADRIRVVAGDVGGGFGAKNHVYPDHVLTMLAAERLGRPVKWIATRSEMHLSDAHGRDQFVRAALALDISGRFIGLRASIIANLGAYLSPRGVVPPILGGRNLQGAYEIPAVQLDVRAVLTNSTPIGTYRGAGAPEVMFVLERLVDCAARECGIDPLEIRRRNLIPVRAMPFKNAFGVSYDREDFHATLDAAVALADWEQFPTRKKISSDRGKLRGIGLSYTLEAAGLGVGEEATVRISADCRVEILIGTMSNGQGHETTYAQIAAGDLGLPVDRIDVVQGDTDRIRNGNGTGASRSITVGGAALRLACYEILTEAKSMAARLLQTTSDRIELTNGVFQVQGGKAAASWAEIAKAAYELNTGLPEADRGLAATRRFEPTNYTCPNGCHICEVEVDPESGKVEVVGYAMAHDVGNAINPEIVAGQLKGGVVQGIGQALSEVVVYDSDGQLLTASFQDYAMPRAADTPDFRLVIKGVPSTINPLGAKGAGEAGATAAPSAVINAVIDALSSFGVRDIEMPATAMRVWAAMQRARGGRLVSSFRSPTSCQKALDSVV